MKAVLSLCYMVLLGSLLVNARGPCGCRPVFDFCANDYATYHSICEYKCKHPSTPFQDWFILYNGPCQMQSLQSSTEVPYTAPTIPITSESHHLYGSFYYFVDCDDALHFSSLVSTAYDSKD